MVMSQTFEPRTPGNNVTTDTRALSHEKVDKQRRYAQILTCLSSIGPMTAKQVAVELWREGFIPSAERNYTAPRLTELAKMGRVEPVGRVKCTYTGRTVAVYGLREA